MNFILRHEDILREKYFHETLLSFLKQDYKQFLFYLDKKSDTIHYILFDKKTKLIQIIFQTPKWSKEKNYDILEYALQRRKIAKNYVTEIDEIVQYNFIVYTNQEVFEMKKWIFEEDKHEFPKEFYQIYIYNINAILKTKKEEFLILQNLWEKFL